MATEAQIAANRRNAESSTGPRTEEGKSRSSRNAVTFGIYSAADFVLPEDEPLYHDFCRNFQKELSPQGPFEQTLAAEIIHAAWRLRRCSVVESSMGETQLDPMANPAFAHVQQTVDRARAQAHRNLHRAATELRRRQTARQARKLLSLKRDAAGAPAAMERTPEPSPAKQTQIARSQPCPCGSGVKYKRCCGRSAPGVLQSELRQAA